MSRLPLIGVTACTKQIGLHPYHITGDKYVRAIAVAAKGLPLILPSLAELIDPTNILDSLDGLLFTGSPSNIEPHLYHGPTSAPDTLHDPDRDRTTLPLIRAALATGVPVPGVCGGFQELNVAPGGSLHQKLHEVDGFIGHREDPSAPSHAMQHSTGRRTGRPGSGRPGGGGFDRRRQGFCFSRAMAPRMAGKL
ncbi:gamma-glutamyl-gamma-aminobutyrate hydrolase [Pseudomonas sp. Lz4W]|nr:gamma-glutamyl-gamma-aminobutyrate hydrolase [Pseudomonas sp. Lz4W]MCH4868059.1 gamma-glutamyl-gamma-aminobutyrate hydrolase [Pseudomonas sp. TMW22089]